MNRLVTISLRLAYPAILIFCVLLFAATVHAQEVYNFYFQKAPGAAPAIQTPPELQTPPSAVTPPPVVAPVNPPVVSSAPNPVAEVKDSLPGFRNWSGQLMHATVSDTNSDISLKVRSRLGFQVGYRFNKYVGIEIGTSVGSLKGRWQDETGTSGFSSVVPFLGLRLNAVHINVFGAEVLEFFANGGTMYIDQTGSLKEAPVVARENNAEFYGYLGGGMRVNFGDRVGLEVAGRVLAGDPANRYGMATTGIDIRF